MRATQGGVGHELDDQGSQVDTPIEAVAKRSKVAAGVFDVVQGVIRARQTGFQIAQHRVDPFELRQVAWVAGADDVDRVGAVGVGDRVEAGETIGQNFAAGARFLTAQSLMAAELKPSTSESLTNKG